MSFLPLMVGVYLMVMIAVVFSSFMYEMSIFMLIVSSFFSLAGAMNIVSLCMKVDQLSVLMTFLTSVITAMTMAVSFSKKKNFFLSSLALIIIFFFVVDSLTWFFILFEMSLVPLMILMVIWGKQAERLMAVQFMILYTLIGSSPLFFSVMSIWDKIGSEQMSLLSSPLAYDVSGSLIDSLGLLAFAIKIPVFLFHSWLPKAHVEAPLEGSMVLAGLMLKVGMYGMIRVLFFLNANNLVMNAIYSLAMMGAMYSVLIALSVDDMKMSVAFSSISHMNVITASLLTMKEIGLKSAIIIMFTHGLCSPILFFLVTKIYMSTQSRSAIVSKGSLSSYPLMSLLSLVVWTINLSTPPFLPFVGEILSFSALLAFMQMSWIWVILYVTVSSFFCMVNYGIHSHSSKKIQFKNLSMDMLFIIYSLMLVVMSIVLFVFQPFWKNMLKVKHSDP